MVTARKENQETFLFRSLEFTNAIFRTLVSLYEIDYGFNVGVSFPKFGQLERKIKGHFSRLLYKTLHDYITMTAEICQGLETLTYRETSLIINWGIHWKVVVVLCTMAKVLQIFLRAVRMVVILVYISTLHGQTVYMVRAVQCNHCQLGVYT